MESDYLRKVFHMLQKIKSAKTKEISTWKKMKIMEPLSGELLI